MYLLKSPFVMCVFSILVDEWIQSFWDNRAVVERQI